MANVSQKTLTWLYNVLSKVRSPVAGADDALTSQTIGIS